MEKVSQIIVVDQSKNGSLVILFPLFGSIEVDKQTSVGGPCARALV